MEEEPGLVEFRNAICAMTDEQFAEFLRWALADLSEMHAPFPAKEFGDLMEGCERDESQPPRPRSDLRRDQRVGR